MFTMKPWSEQTRVVREQVTEESEENLNFL